MLKGAFDFTNRNARPPKKSNHGARPCSSVMRRLKKKYYYRRTKEAMTPEMEAKKTFEVWDIYNIMFALFYCVYLHMKIRTF